MKNFYEYVKLIFKTSISTMYFFISVLLTILGLVGLVGVKIELAKKCLIVVIILLWIVFIFRSQYKIYKEYCFCVTFYPRKEKRIIVAEISSQNKCGIGGSISFAVDADNKYPSKDYISSIEISEPKINNGKFTILTDEIFFSSTDKMCRDIGLAKYGKNADKIINFPYDIPGKDVKTIFILVPFHLDFESSLEMNHFFEKVKSIELEYRIETMRNKKTMVETFEVSELNKSKSKLIRAMESEFEVEIS